MATLVTHALLPVLAGRPHAPAAPSRGWLLAAAVFCSCLPDVDIVAYAFDLRPPAALAHRGLTHSLAFAAALSAVAALLLCAKDRRPLKRVFAFLFVVTASHGLFDAFTQGDFGVALFWPITARRFWLPLHPVPVVPVGADEMLGRLGALAVLNELLLIWLPVLLVSLAVSLKQKQRPLRRVGALAVAGVLAFIGLKAAFPSEVAPVPRRPLRSFGDPGSPENPEGIPLDGLPQGRLVTHLDELRALGLFDVELKPAEQPWSSTFFPSWFGGTASRWRDGRLTLIGRTLTGFDAMAAEPTRKLVADAQHDAGAAARLFALAPTEKYDLALGDYGFAVTHYELDSSHNARPRPRFWWGFCNGVATAALERPEPFRVVDVVNPQGQKIRFHPNDVKALMAWAYYWAQDSITLGAPCSRATFDPTDTCGMNPGGVVLALLNRIGLAHRSFLIDVDPTPQSQHYAIASAKVALLAGPYPYDDRLLTPRLAGHVRSLVDVDISLELSATTLPLDSADLPTADPTRYQRVGLRVVPFEWRATLALDDAGNIIGGAWRDNGPDELTFVSGGPLLDGGVLEAVPVLRWPLVDAIATASVDDAAAVPTVVAAEALDAGRSSP